MKRTRVVADRFLQLLYLPSLPLPCPCLSKMSPSVAVLLSVPSADRPSPWFAGWATTIRRLEVIIMHREWRKKRGRGKDDARIQPVWVRCGRSGGVSEGRASGMIGEFVGFNEGSEGQRRPWGRWYLAERLPADKRNRALVMWYTESPVYLVYPPTMSILCG